MRKIKLNNLHVDLSYQREALSSEVNRIKKNFKWDFFGYLIVAQRGRKFYIIDGQHRWLAVKELVEEGELDIKELECLVVVTKSKEEEAAIFHAVNRGRRNPNSVDSFKATVTAGDKLAKQTLRIIEDCGFGVVGIHEEEKLLKIRSISSCVGICKKSPETLRSTLNMIWEAWAKKDYEATDAVRRDIILGVSAIFMRQDNVIEKDLLRTLTSVSPRYLIQDAQSEVRMTGGSRFLCVHDHIVKLYNQRQTLRTRKLVKS